MLDGIAVKTDKEAIDEAACEPVHVVIKPKEVCKEEILRKNPHFYEEFTSEVRSLKGIEYVKHDDSAIYVHILEDHKFELMKFIEQFIYRTCRIDDPYKVLDIIAEEDTAREQIRAYIESFDERMLDEMFDELERRLNEREEKDAPKETEREKADQNRTGFDYPVRFSPEMISYVKELREVTKTLNEIGSIDQFFTKSLLISIDDGWGYSAFLKAIRNELMPYFEEKASDILILERTISYNEGINGWAGQPGEMKRISKDMVSSKKFAIVAYDMCQWMTEISNPALLNHIRRIGQYSQNVLCVFRIPYVEMKVARNMERHLSNVLSMRTIVVPPVSTENMVVYLKNKLKESNFITKSECDELLEQWICQEKNEGNFYGYKTLDKMAGELIYHKALHGDKEKALTFIKEKDIQPMLADQLVAEDAYQLLEELIGIAQVKTKVREIIAQIKMQKTLEEQGKFVEKPSIHMMFLGNPGTGKTTVARIVGQILKQEGILRKGQFYEKQGNDFVARYLGQSASLVRACCRDAYGSVLFIDEAYGMSVSTSKGNATDEIIPVLIAEMENHRDDMCVIMAGYTDEMKEFVKENAGLESRIPHIVEFPNYTREELVKIFFRMLEGKFEYEEALKEAITEYIQNISEERFRTKEFSNARFIRNLYEHIWGKAAYRISLSGETEMILKKEDVVSVIEEEDFFHMVEEKGTRKIGF